MRNREGKWWRGQAIYYRAALEDIQMIIGEDGLKNGVHRDPVLVAIDRKVTAALSKDHDLLPP